MAHKLTTIEVATDGQGLYPITEPVTAWLSSQHVGTGLLTVFVQHSTASVVIQENADPDVLADLHGFFARLAPEGFPYRHSAEGADDMPGHIKAALTPTSLSIPIEAGQLVLGMWQGLYLFEHRVARRTRKVVLHALSD